MPEQMQRPPGQAPGNPRQDDYDIFVSQGFKILGDIGPKLQGKASVEQLGNTLFSIVDRVEQGGEKNGIPFDLSVILHGSNEILGKMLEMAKVDITEEQVKAVVGIAVGRYVENAINTGKMTPEQVQGLAQEAQGSMPGQGAQPGPQSPGQTPPGLLQGA